MTIEEIEKRREARRAKQDEAKAEQAAKDLEAIDAIEAETGVSLNVMTANGFVPGAPVKMAFRPPTKLEYKRYCDTVGNALQKVDAKARREAQETLAKVCLVYPKGDDLAACLDAYPGALISLAIEAAKIAESRSEEEGKG